MADYAKSLWPTCVWAMRRRLSGAGRAARAGAAQGGVGSEVVVEVAKRVGSRLAQRGQPNPDRAGGWRLTLKADCG